MHDAELARAFERHRRYLFGVCYRMTGTAADAEDLVQHTFERALEQRPETGERELKPWLTRVAINASRDHLRKRRRQAYQGPWLPEPWPTPDGLAAELQGSEGPDARYTRLESLSLAFMIALEALSPAQRAVLLLRDVLDFSVRESAEFLGISESNVKTTLHRARVAMEVYDAGRQQITPELQTRTRRALQAFLVHAASGNEAALRALLSDDVVMLNDGAGEFFAAQKPVVGVSRVITFVRKTRRVGKFRARMAVFNGLPAVVGVVPSDNPRIPQRMVIWVELDANGRIARTCWQLATKKLAPELFAELPAGPELPVVLESLRAAWALPGPRAWVGPTLATVGAELRRRAEKRVRRAR